MLERKSQFSKEGIRHATINGHRIHLRLMDPTKQNYLWIDGRNMLVIDQTAADFWKHIIDAMWLYQQGDGDNTENVKKYVVEKMLSLYPKIPRERIINDLDKNYGLVMEAANRECPIEAGLGVKEVEIDKWIAPMRMDLAVTYRCNLDCEKCYLDSASMKDMKELSLKDWIKIYKILWEIGVHHVTFTGGEPLIRNDIVELVSEAEEFVTGLITNGTLLAKKVRQLKNASLDYCQVTLESSKKEIHETMTGTPDSFEQTILGIKKALNEGLQVVTNTTLTRVNAGDFLALLEFGKSLGLKHMACNTLICSGQGISCRKEQGLDIEEIKSILNKACKKAKHLGIELQWYSPTCYKELNPVDMGFGVKQCSAACYNMTIQPDGTVLPCQSWPKIIGNILTDKWQTIWNNEVCKKLRKHMYAPEKCWGCKFEVTCGGACPLENPKGEK